jgi:hypothetical protein
MRGDGGAYRDGFMKLKCETHDCDSVAIYFYKSKYSYYTLTHRCRQHPMNPLLLNIWQEIPYKEYLVAEVMGS